MLPWPGQPVRGGGLRVWGLGEGLKSAGHEVRYSLPREAVTEGLQLPDEYTSLLHEPETLNNVVLDVMPDVVIVEQWGLASFLDDLKIPLVIDLHGPLSLENAFKDGGNFLSDALTKIDTLAKADLLICPGEFQKQYFLSWFLLAGADPQSAPIEVVPVALGKELPAHAWPKTLKFVFGGVTWPWIDPFPGLETLAKRIAADKSATLDLFVGAPPINYNHPLYAINKNIFRDYRERLAGLERVTLRDFIPRDELLEVYAHSSAAFDLYQPNTERQLAFTTRTVEYLWCGLPVIYGDYGELAAAIREYDAGWVVDPRDQRALDKALDEIFSTPVVVAAKGANARRLAAERFTWDKAITPLARFVENPRFRDKKPSVLSGFRDYFRKESVSQILDAKNEISELNAELRRATTQAEADRRERDKKIEDLSDQIKLLILEHDKEIKSLAGRQRDEVLRKEEDVRRLQEKLDREVQVRDDELQRLRLESQAAGKKDQTKIERLTQEKEKLRETGAAEVKAVIEKKDEELKQLKQERELERDKLQQRVDELVKQMAAEKAKAGDEIKTLNKEKEALRDTAAADVRTVIEKKDDELKEIKREFEAERTKLQLRIDELVKETAIEKAKADDEIKSLNREKEELRQTTAAEVRAVNEKKDDEAKETKRQFEAERTKLQLRIDELVKETAAEKAKADDEIKTLNKAKEELRNAAAADVKSVIEKKDEELKESRREFENERNRLQQRFDEQVKEFAAERAKAADDIKALNFEKEETRKTHEQDIKKLVERHETETDRAKLAFDEERKEAQRKLTREGERREDLDRELNAEIKRLNVRIETLNEQHNHAQDELHKSHEQALNQAREQAESQINKRDETITRLSDRLDRVREDTEKRIKELEAEKSKLLAANEDTIGRLQNELTSLTKQLQELGPSIAERDAHIKTLDESLGRSKEKTEALEKELAVKKADNDKLVHELDAMNEEIAGKLIDLERVILEKERYVEEGEKRFAMLEDRAEKQRHQLGILEGAMAQARTDVERATAALNDRITESNGLREDLEKVRRAARDLEGEVTVLRKQAALYERLLSEFESDDDLKTRLRRGKRTQRVLTQLPRLAYLFTVNLATNAYMEFWQKRTGKKIFPGS
jgi:glycosyltransferase involved in cell wall biosynthesis